MNHLRSRILARVRSAAFGISPSEATFSKRGFEPATLEGHVQLEKIGGTFITGYNDALALSAPAELSLALNSEELEFRGFAFEGAAMALTLLDHLSPGHGTRLDKFLHGSGEPHSYMVHVGAGWAFAR